MFSKKEGLDLDKYYVYSIKEEFAYHYFYKSDILFRFLNLYQENKSRLDLSTQYQYITNDFPEDALISHLRKFYPHKISIQIERNEIIIYNNDQSIKLHIHKKHLEFYCETLYDAEDLLFPILRIFHPLLFIMSTNNIDYGWISPIMNRNEFKNRPKLYSYL